MKPLCYAPFIGMYVSTKNGYAPCCESETFKAAGPKQFWTGEDLSAIRKDLLEGKFPDSCAICMKKVSLGLQSDVEYWNNEYNALERPDISKLTGPMILDYRPSNHCNLKCRMCGPGASSSIENEVKANPELIEWFGRPKDDLDIHDQMIEYIQEINLVKIKIIGGEPAIDPGIWKFIDVVSKFNPKPTLKITTNGTSSNPKFIELLNRFEKIIITFSVDAIGAEYDYIRTNARWKKTEKNILNFMQNKNNKFSFNVVLTPFNIFSLNPLIDWFDSLMLSGHKFQVNFMDSDDAVTSLSAILPEHIDDALNSLNMKKLKNIDCAELMYILESASFNETAHASFKGFAAALDKVRKTHIIDLDHRFNSYIEKAPV